MIISSRKSIAVIQKSFKATRGKEIFLLPPRIIMELPKRLIQLCSTWGDAAPAQDTDTEMPAGEGGERNFR